MAEPGGAARVGLVFGGRSTEHRVSVDSARTVARALAEAGYEVVPLGVARDGCWVAPEAARAALAAEVDALAAVGRPVRETLGHLLDSPAEVIFPLIHGTWGEDGSLQGLCEMLDLPYAGAGVTASALAMDKVLTKRQLEAAGLPVVESCTFDREELEADPGACLARAGDLPLPLFVKPAAGGSSVGVSRVDDRACLETAVRLALNFDERVLVERGVAGRELECAVLGYRRLEASAVGEILPSQAFYDYRDKYLLDTAGLVAPAELPAETAERIRELAVAAFGALGGWGMARVDFLLEGSGGALYVNEINTLPGFTAISMYPRLWDLAGVPLPALVGRLVEIARRRHRDRRRLDQGIRDWLAELSISI